MTTIPPSSNFTILLTPFYDLQSEKISFGNSGRVAKLVPTLKTGSKISARLPTS